MKALREFFTRVGLWIMLGLTLTATTSAITNKIDLGLSGLTMFFCSIIGVIISVILINSLRYKRAIIGFLLLSITLGLFISPILRGVENDVILNVSILVTLITLLMSISGLMFPKFYSKISGILCITSIICFIVFPILHFYIPSLNLTIWDYLVSGFFALNIGYETSKGSKGDLDKISAIRVATNLYVSSIMLFAKIINLYSDAKSKVAM